MGDTTIVRDGRGALLGGFLLALVIGSHTGASGGTRDLKLLLAIGCFVGMVVLTIYAPHVFAAVAIPVFASIPMLKVLFVPWIGPLKDAMIVAAVIGCAVLALQRRLAHENHPMDAVLVILIAGFLGLYILDLGAGFGTEAYGGQWQQGVRLTAEPLLLLLVGLTVRWPAKVLRWSLVSLVATSAAVALYGLYQQKVGQWALVDMGYEFDINVRTINGHLRSFGTLDDAFAYAALLLFGVAALLFMRINRWIAVSVASLLLLGILASYVRTAAVVLAALGGIWLARKGQSVVAVLAVGGAVAASVVLLASQAATQTHTVQASPNTYLSINGRTDVWKDVLGDKSQWPLGKGVGEVGTAADRAKFGVYQTANSARAKATTAVDSGYLAIVADVGFLGLAVFLCILGRLAQLCVRFARGGERAGWIGGSILLVMTIDAVTRASFIGFPTAFLGLLLVGIAINVGLRANVVPRAPDPSR
jgi:hypothetical protein